MISQAQAYQEVYNILKNMDKKIVMKVPQKILEYIIDNRDKEYKTKIEEKDLFNPDNIDDRTCNILLWLNLNYWADETEKKELNTILNNNEIKLENEKNKKFSKDIFSDSKVINLLNEENGEEKNIIEYKEKIFIQKIFDKIKSIFIRK